MKLEVGILLAPLKDGPAAADLDVVRMGSQAEDGTKGSGGELDHCGLLSCYRG